MNLEDPSLYINRELSWLAFNERVLEEAADAALPLYERLKFLGIFSSNLDEFFMIRVAGLKQQILGRVTETSADGLTAGEQLLAISRRVHDLVERQYETWNNTVLPQLAERGVHLRSPDDFSEREASACHTYFRQHVYPALTPLAVDPGHPFPHLRNKSLNIALFLERDGLPKRRDKTATLAVIQVPSVMSRLVPLRVDAGIGFMLLESIIARYGGEMFPGYRVHEAAAFRVTRNWDLNVDEEEADDLRFAVEEELRRRDRGAAVRLELDARASVTMATVLSKALNLEVPDIYHLNGPIQLNDIMALESHDPRPEMRVEPFVSAPPMMLRADTPIYEQIRDRDALLMTPYESYDPVVRFIAEAADDPNVLAIKQTLYRTSGDSPFVSALTRAAENGKQVAVLVEIKARFDEANNLAWARQLEESGVHVVYGLVGLKTHCKVSMVVRREGDKLRRYIHLGTGNYNHQTARYYTDLSLFTSRTEFADDATDLFNMLTGLSEAPIWRKLAVAPTNLRTRIIELIDEQAELARKSRPSRIRAKMNSLADPSVIRALYRASIAGVPIDLNVRGICCLRPGVPGVSETIRVTSIVDRLLEHSRIFSFGDGDAAQVYLASCDWMPRNFLRRVEVMFPIEEAALRKRILDELLPTTFADNVKARALQPDGTYLRTPLDGPPIRSQLAMLEIARIASATAQPKTEWQPLLPGTGISDRGRAHAGLSLTPRDSD